jgi:hypothetical protein
MGDVTQGEDAYGFYWKSSITGGAIFYTKDNTYAQYSNHIWDEDDNDMGMWGWDTEGVVWSRDADYNFDIEDIDGNVAYYVEADDEWYLYNVQHEELFWWDDSTHHLRPYNSDNIIMK